MTIYIVIIYRHAEALIPLDEKRSQQIDNLSVSNGKDLKVKETITKHILDVIYDDIDKKMWNYVKFLQKVFHFLFFLKKDVRC